MIPKIIGPIQPSGSRPDGIINAIINKHKVIDPISKGIVIPSSSETNFGFIGNTIMWNSSLWGTKMFSGPYFQLEFPKSILFLSGYSMKGIIRSGENTCYQKSWRIEGFNKGEESDTSKWKLIGRNSSSEDNFCGSTQWCTSSDIATYKLTQQTTGFNFIRWTAESTYCKSISSTRFVTAGIEVYGKLTTDSGNKKIVCTCFLYRAPLISPAICTILFSL